MHFSFEHHDITTIGASIAKQVRKRKHLDAGYGHHDAASKKVKVEVGAACSELNPSASLKDDVESQVTKVDSTATPSEYTASAVTSRGSTPSAAFPPIRNKGGRPRTKPLASVPPTRNLKKATVLRVNRLVKAELPMDIWLHVFKYCKPDFLFKIRSISKSFKDALSKESAWSQTLCQQFGSNLPPPPPGLSYMNYANLLTQHGCQCCRDEGKGSTRRTYWAFQRRFCETCLDKNIVFVRSMSVLVATFAD